MARSYLSPAARDRVDLALRVVFFASAPFAIVGAAVLFPVWGALASVVLSLLVFVAGETIRRWATAWPLLTKLVDRELAIEAFYRERSPRAFLYYVFYPLLFPYWLTNREARREFWLFKGYTLASVALLLLNIAYQYVFYWRPELGFRAYWPIVLQTLAVETLLVIALLMPIATTVIDFHKRQKRGPLLLLLLLGLTSTVIASARFLRRRDPVVSYATRERVRRRTAAAKKPAKQAQLAALKSAWDLMAMQPIGLDGDGKVEGEVLDRAHEALEQFYKHDEAFSFDLWASPLKRPTVLVLYFEATGNKAAIWSATLQHGTEITDARKLPRGAFVAMKHAEDNLAVRARRRARGSDRAVSPSRSRAPRRRRSRCRRR